jgi:hypothetical protein
MLNKKDFPDGTNIVCLDEANHGEIAVVEYADHTLGVLAKITPVVMWFTGEENKSSNKWVYYFANDIKCIPFVENGRW